MRRTATLDRGSLRAEIAPLLGSALGGALLTVVGLLLYYLGSGFAAAYPPLIWQPGESTSVVLGQGRVTPDGLEIQPSDHTVFFWFFDKPFLARPYNRLIWKIDGLSARQDVRLFWQTRTDGGVARQLPVPFVDQQKEQLELRGHPHWRGDVVNLGLAVSGFLPRPLLVRKIELLPETMGVGALLDQAWQEWTTSEYWSQRSAHYIGSGPRQALFPPVITIAIWIGLSMTLYGFWWLANQQRRRGLVPWAALFLIGWWVLDLRWQFDLAQHSIITAERFSGKNRVEKKLAANDGDLFGFLQKIRSHLPAQPARIFILNNDADNRRDLRNYTTARARYHLQPHNSFADVYDWSLLSNARPGDYILVLQPDQGALKQQSDLQYDPQQRQLRWKSGGVPVEAIYREPLGQLLRVPAS